MIFKSRYNFLFLSIEFRCWGCACTHIISPSFIELCEVCEEVFMKFQQIHQLLHTFCVTGTGRTNLKVPVQKQSCSYSKYPLQWNKVCRAQASSIGEFPFKRVQSIKLTMKQIPPGFIKLTWVTLLCWRHRAPVTVYWDNEVSHAENNKHNSISFYNVFGLILFSSIRPMTKFWDGGVGVMSFLKERGI